MKIIHKISIILSLIIIGLITLILYGVYIIDFIQNNLLNFFNLMLRGREISAILLIICLPFFFFKPKSFKVLNIFLIIFNITILFNISLTNLELYKNFKSSYANFSSTKNDTIKPVLLIIADEYSSPNELNKIKKDSNLFSFSKMLEKEKWNVRNESISIETSTIHSMSSLFNFNLSNDSNYKHQTISDIGKNELLKCKLKDSLDKKSIDVINFGIFNIGKSKHLSRLYFYPINFCEELFSNTSYFKIKQNTHSFDLSGFKTNFYPMEGHNKYIFSHFVDSIKNISSKKTFVYTHLYMPHSPMQFLPEFKYKNQSTDNYLNYWNFTNIKLLSLLKNLTRENKYRIILTGDHGYRGDKKIDPHNTFTAFYGFEKADIEQIKSVQDLGSLINHYF